MVQNRLVDVVRFHDDSALAILVTQETCIQAVCTVMPNVQHMTNEEKLQILDMLGLIETRIPPGDIAKERNAQQQRDKRKAQKARARARAREEAGIKPGPKPGTVYRSRQRKSVTDDELIQPVDPHEFEDSDA